MFSCSSCSRRCVDNLISIHARPLSRRQLRHTSQAVRQVRELASASPQPDDDQRRPATWWDSPAKKEHERALKVAQTKRPAQAVETFESGKLRRELARHGHDAYTLAERIAQLIRKKNLEKAEALVILASRKGGDYIVSWNHLIDHHIRFGNPKDALALYNDMKKRGQKPDSYTFAILLRGFAEHGSHPKSLGNALAVYHSMGTPTSPVKPSIIHTNSMLKVCARSDDLDAMWGVISKLPEHGPGSPDSITYTLILHQLQRHAVLSAASQTDLDAAARVREEAVVQGRQLWDIIVRRWRRGDVFVDDKLTCAMGRLLLAGARPRDWDDVLSLINQTMGIPRLAPRLHTDGLGAHIRAPFIPANFKVPYTPADGEKAPEGQEFLPLEGSNQPSTHASQGRGKIYAQPTNDVLSLVLESCLKTVARDTADAYWQLLTDPNGYAIVPDLDNYHARLRILRQAQRSTDALKLVRDQMIPAGFKPWPKTYRLALSACSRDASNHIAFDNASSLLDLMQSQLSVPDAKSLALYANLASRTSAANAVTRALARLHPKNIEYKALFGLGQSKIAIGQQPSPGEGQELLANLIRLCDQALSFKSLPKAAEKDCIEARGFYAKLMTRLNPQALTKAVSSQSKRANTPYQCSRSVERQGKARTFNDRMAERVRL